MPTVPPTVPPLTPPPPPGATPEPPPSPWIASRLAPVTWRVEEIAVEAILFVCTIGIGWLAWWIITWDSGRSPAKTILHMRVVYAETRAVPGFGRMALREAVGKGVPGLAGLIGLYSLGGGSPAARFLIAAALAWLAMSGVAALLDRERRTLWDTFSGTIVVLDPDVNPTVAADIAP
jgi:hypothetical protein